MKLNEIYQVEFLNDALQDMTEIISSFSMMGSKNGAVRINNKINKATQRIALFPYSGITVNDNQLAKWGFRMIIIEKYLMFYRVFEDEKKVVFYRVLNGTSNYLAILKRLKFDFEK